jgi:hypothetical protein
MDTLSSVLLSAINTSSLYLPVISFSKKKLSSCVKFFLHLIKLYGMKTGGVVGHFKHF